MNCIEAEIRSYANEVLRKGAEDYAIEFRCPDLMLAHYIYPSTRTRIRVAVMDPASYQELYDYLRDVK